MNRIFICDLTHTALGISALSFPLGASFVASYAKEKVGDRYDVQLFKFPEALAEAFEQQPPKVIGFSSFSWNFELNYSVAQWVKKTYPEIVVFFGGPNFPTEAQEKKDFLADRPAIDFYIQNEGEVGFVETVLQLEEVNFDIEKLKSSHSNITNCVYLDGDDLISGDIKRITDINIIPSPYLTGMLDQFFGTPLVPMVETTRGCPFSCAFCADGLASKNKVIRFDSERTSDELEYIAQRIRNINELTITDLNFGMYKQDKKTAEAIARVQKKYSWPLFVGASSGKNQPKRIIEAAKIMNGAWAFGASIQTTDEEVLKNISRSNISLDAYRELTDFVKSLGTASSMSEIILGLPGDSKKKHFTSLKYCIENGIDSVRMFQAMMLLGTDMASKETRKMHGIETRFRVIPGCAGEYEFGNDKIRVCEMDEIIVTANDLTFDDYVSCRLMNLLIESFFNNRLFEEFFREIENVGIKTFDIIEYMHGNNEVFSPKVLEIIASFKRETAEDLFLTRVDVDKAVLSDEFFNGVMSEKAGNNELLDHRALLYLEYEEMAAALMQAARNMLSDRGELTDEISNYLSEVARFEISRKAAVHDQAGDRVEKFNYDFSRKASPANENGSTWKREPVETKLRFYHTDKQRGYIDNSVNLYKHHPGGIGRMIQRSDLKLCFRQVEKLA